MATRGVVSSLDDQDGALAASILGAGSLTAQATLLASLSALLTSQALVSGAVVDGGEPEPSPGDDVAGTALDGVFPVLDLDADALPVIAAALTSEPAITCSSSLAAVLAGTLTTAATIQITTYATTTEGLMADTFIATTRVKVFFLFTRDGRAFDPRILDVLVKAPSGVRTTYRQGRDAQIRRLSIGSYYVEILASEAGVYHALGMSTATGEELVVEKTFTVKSVEQALAS